MFEGEKFIGQIFEWVVSSHQKKYCVSLNRLVIWLISDSLLSIAPTQQWVFLPQLAHPNPSHSFLVDFLDHDK